MKELYIFIFTHLFCMFLHMVFRIYNSCALLPVSCYATHIYSNAFCFFPKCGGRGGEVGGGGGEDDQSPWQKEKSEQ